MVAEAILGIDLGSTSSRAFIWCPSKNGEYHVENKTRHSLTSIRYEKGDFSSTGYPFDDGEVYLGETQDPNRKPTSLKFGFYVLSNASDDLVEQYSLVQPLLERKNDKHFRGRLIQGLEGLLKALQVRVSQICKSKRLSISTIGLSVPAQWNLDFEKVYQELVARVFNHPPSEIYFHTETEALAHYLFKDHLGDLQDHGAHDGLLFLDFGGHNMNGCMFKVVYGDDETVNFYRAGDSFGAGGGSEQWEYNIGRSCDAYLKRVQQVSAKTRQTILDAFCREKTTLGPENSRTMTLSLEDPKGRAWKIVLDSHIIDQAFEDAFLAPLEVATEQIAQLSNHKCLSRRVIVSGGTSRNHTLQSRLRKLCADASLPEPLFTDTLEINYDTVKIAKGVAYAAGNHRTVEEFFQSGAAFGLQMRQQDTRWNTNPDRLWDDCAYFVLDENRQKTRRLYMTGRDELKLVCDPFWSASQDITEEDVLQYEKCYDILPLGRPTRGHWCYKFSLSGSGDSMHLTMDRLKRSTKSSVYKHFDTKVFPLQFDRGTNCVYVGVRGHSLEELGLSMEQVTPAIDEESLPQEQDTHMDDAETEEEERGVFLQRMAYQVLSCDTAGDEAANEEPTLQLMSPALTATRSKTPESPRKARKVEYRKRHHPYEK